MSNHTESDTVGRLRPCWRGIAGWFVLLFAVVNLGRFALPSNSVRIVTTTLVVLGCLLLAPVLARRFERR